MLLYSILMFGVSALMIVFSILIYRGKTNLIHSYHQTKVKDFSAYGKAFGKALLVVGLAPLVSGIAALFGDDKPIAMAAVLILILGLAAGVACILAVQKKYNNGLF